MAETPELAAEKVIDELKREILNVQEEAYGAGARTVQVGLMEDFVLIILDVVLTQAEQTLIDADRGDAVIATREAFQDAIAPTFTAIVERATGRRVSSFVSKMVLKPLYSVELFRLEPHRP